MGDTLTKEDCLKVLECAGNERLYVRTERCATLQWVVERLFDRLAQVDSRPSSREAMRQWLLEAFQAKVEELESLGACIGYDAVLRGVIHMTPVHPYLSGEAVG